MERNQVVQRYTKQEVLHVIKQLYDMQSTLMIHHIDDPAFVSFLRPLIPAVNMLHEYAQSLTADNPFKGVLK